MNGKFTENLPLVFKRNVFGVCGEKGLQWLEALPEILDEISKNWSLRVKNHFPNLSYNFVADCVCADENEAVLKIGLPEENPEIFDEAEFLKTAKGKGAVEILNLDEKRGAMLLEKLKPGKHLKEIFFDEKPKAIEAAIDVMRKLWRKPPVNHSFRRLENWFAGLDRAERTRFPREYAEKARETFRRLHSSSDALLLHGDLHHENILSAQRESFLAIDPKGIVGDSGYEIAVFLNNHALWLSSDETEENVNEKLKNAVARFSESFSIKPENLFRWAYAQMVLSAFWTFEENGKDWEKDLNRAEIW